MIAGKAQEQIRVGEFAFVASRLVGAETGKRPARRRAAGGERVSPRPVRNSPRPIEMGAARLAKRRNHPAELGMHGSAVIAFVVVLADHLPIRADLVLDGAPDPKVLERIALHTL